MMFVLMGLACQDDGGKKVAPLDSAEGYAVAFFPDISENTVVPQWNVEQAQIAFAEMSHGVLPAVPVIREEFFSLLSQGDENCPGSTTQLSPDILHGCTSTTGYHYNGLSSWMTVFELIEMEDIPMDVEPEGGWLITGDMEIVTPEGLVWQAGGHVALTLWPDDNNYPVVRGELQGSWKWEGGEDWLAQTFSGLFYYWVFALGGEHEVLLEGASTIGGLSLMFGDVAIHESCPSSFSGTIGIRDPSGIWHYADGDNACEPCVEHRVGDQPTGEEICLDVAPLYEHVMAQRGVE